MEGRRLREIARCAAVTVRASLSFLEREKQLADDDDAKSQHGRFPFEVEDVEFSQGGDHGFRIDSEPMWKSYFSTRVLLEAKQNSTLIGILHYSIKVEMSDRYTGELHGINIRKRREKKKKKGEGGFRSSSMIR